MAYKGDDNLIENESRTLKEKGGWNLGMIALVISISAIFFYITFTASLQDWEGIIGGYIALIVWGISLVISSFLALGSILANPKWSNWPAFGASLLNIGFTIYLFT